MDRQHRWRALTLAAGLTGCMAGSWGSWVSVGPGDDQDAAIAVPDASAAVVEGLPEEQACAILNRAKCERLAGCGLLAMSQSACEETERRLRCGPTTWPAHVATGALRYDGAAAATCASDWALRACADALTAPASCDQVLLANAVLGQPCYDGYRECRSGVCRGLVCPKQCQPLGLTGEVCALDADCRQDLGLFCRLAPDMAGVGVCAAMAASNEACDDITPCAGGLVCVANTCRPRPPVGAGCLLGTCDDAGFCLATPDGGTCTRRGELDATCAPGTCQAPLFCLASRCAPTLAASGAACAEGQSCPVATVCLGLQPGLRGRCAPPLGSGGPCASHGDCREDLACLPTSDDAGARCGPRRRLGQPCDDARACTVDALCASGVCAPAPVVGSNCSSTLPCAEGRCVATDGGSRCVARKGSLEPCQSDADCASQVCGFGRCRASCTP